MRYKAGPQKCLEPEDKRQDKNTKKKDIKERLMNRWDDSEIRT